MACLDSLFEKSLHFGDEHRARELIREHGGEADGNGGRYGISRQATQDFQERQIGIESGLTDPVAAVRPAPMVQDVRQMTVQREDEIR